MWRNFLQSLFKVSDTRMFAVCGIDAIVVAAAATAAFFLRFPIEMATEDLADFWWVVPLGVGVRIVLFWLFGLYRWAWYYMGIREVLYLAGAITVSSVVLGGIAYGLDATFPETLLLVDWLLVMAVMLGERLSIQLWRERSTGQTLPEIGKESKRILVVGTGDAAEEVSREIEKRRSHGDRLVGYAGDDSSKWVIRKKESNQDVTK